MPRATGAKAYNTFVKGLVTEASPLTYPENASIDEENFVLNRDGSRQRRLGLDYEDSYVLSSNIATTTFSDLAVTSHEWRNAANNGLYNFAVIQTGATLRFYSLSASSISAGVKSFTIDLTTYKTSFATNIGSQPIQVSAGKGFLFVVSKDTDPFYVEYNPTADTISTTRITLKQRDFLGLSDGYTTDEQPTALTDAHKYNLLNQGWDTTKIGTYFTSQAKYPSNAQIWMLGKDTSDNFDAALLVKQYVGNTPAPKGHFILDTYSRDRTTASGVPNLTTEIEEHRPTTTAFYAGRVWYAGVQSKVNTGPTINGDIYFSQILVDPSYAGLCYQQSDPTSEEISDILDTDGGIIRIPEIENVIELVPIRNALVVIASNGVWQISGATDAGFLATSYQVIKITDVGAIAADTVVAVENKAFYWAESGIYLLTPDEVSGTLVAKNLTETTIQTLYLDISSVGKLYATANYDATARRVTWLYNDSDSYTGATYKYKYDTELVFDLVLGSWSKYTISSLASLSPYVAGYITTPSFNVLSNAFNVVVGGVQVQVSAVNVTLTETYQAEGLVSSKYLVVKPQSGGTNSKITFGLYNNTTFMDWKTADGTGITYSSYLVTGYELFGDIMRKKDVVYLVTHFNKTETGFTQTGDALNLISPSSCMIQYRWDWSDHTNSGKWGTAFQAYRFLRNYIPDNVNDPFNYGYSVIVTKNKIRGTGKALSFYIYSETGKDLQLLGWSVLAGGGTSV